MGNQQSNGGEGTSQAGHVPNIFGNNSSSSAGASRSSRHPPFAGLNMRNTLAQAMQDNLRTGTLGLSKSELDKRCQPSGLYNGCFWDERIIRRLIGDGKLAARLKGTEERTSPTDQECPICFLYYNQTNVSKCCNATICTECYLQVRPQHKANKQRPDQTVTACASGCPFCNNPKLYVSIADPLEDEQVKERELEEQRMLEAKIRERVTCMGSSGDLNSTSDTAESDDSVDSKVFGSSLERHSRFLMRARSESNASSFSGADTPSTPRQGDNVISQIAMTPEERRMLEAEMRAQLSHPVALRLEAEAAERQLEHDQAHRARTPTSSRSRRRGRDWNRIIDAFERGGNGQVQSIDDLVVLEAAILLSAEEEARREGRRSQALSGTENGGEGENSSEQAPSEGRAAVAPAAAASGTANNSNSERESDGDNQERPFDIARHAREGFPLVQAFLASRFTNNNNNNNSGSNNDGDDENTRNRAEHEDAIERALNSPLMRNLTQSINRGRNRLLQTHRRPPTATLDASSLLMRGMSEEQQLEMAIAASLRDQQQQEQARERGSNGDSSPEDGDGSERAQGESLRVSDQVGEETNSSMHVVTEEPSESDIDSIVGQSNDDGDGESGNDGPQNIDADVDRLLREAAELMGETFLDDPPAIENPEEGGAAVGSNVQSGRSSPAASGN